MFTLVLPSCFPVDCGETRGQRFRRSPPLRHLTEDDVLGVLLGLRASGSCSSPSSEQGCSRRVGQARRGARLLQSRKLVASAGLEGFPILRPTPPIGSRYTRSALCRSRATAHPAVKLASAVRHRVALAGRAAPVSRSASPVQSLRPSASDHKSDLMTRAHVVVVISWRLGGDPAPRSAKGGWGWSRPPGQSP